MMTDILVQEIENALELLQENLTEAALLKSCAGQRAFHLDMADGNAKEPLAEALKDILDAVEEHIDENARPFILRISDALSEMKTPQGGQNP